VQHLPPRQRAVLLLRDVLDWRAAEVAEVLGTTATAVNSALRRARAGLAAAGVTEDDVADALDPGARALVDRYVTAFQAADVGGLVAVLTEDATLEMPPEPLRLAGRDAVAGFVAAACGSHRVAAPVVANGQPAIAVHTRAGDRLVPHSVQVFTVTRGGIARIDVFRDPRVLAAFGLTARHLPVPA
jgi:RNA polymerase sigma-70 factor (ECF subfamily)